MAGKRLKPIEAATAGILATLIFLLAWSIVERVTDTRPKGALPAPRSTPLTRQGHGPRRASNRRPSTTSGPPRRGARTDRFPCYPQPHRAASFFGVGKNS
jgi:hypothetical protein